ncbi:hypothetical protein ACFWVP_19990 [Streptomyces sp. NPDC058637]|uniref:hypothetical protein n=1 Tax=Streptomyces sp. NPDC058637 TaxID=3346569 RepID=UPI00366A2830
MDYDPKGHLTKQLGVKQLPASGRLVTVASVVTGIVRLLADDPGTAILHGLAARMCATLNRATRPDDQRRDLHTQPVFPGQEAVGNMR